MPFGLANAQACFQIFIQWGLREYLDVFCFVYLNDILFFSETEEDHLNHIEKILKALSEHQPTASPEKCSFFQSSVVFLGFVISVSGILMDPEKLKTISDWPFPLDLRELRRFLGFSNFYRRFIKNFSGVAAPLTALTAKGTDIIKNLRNEGAILAFKRIKDIFSSKPFLIHFEFSLPRVIHVDSSGYAYSGILSQKGVDGELHPVAYFSKKLNDSEKGWQVHDQELGAIVACFEEWSSWLLGSQVPTLVFSDHSNLRYFMTAQSLTAKQARWASFLSEFSFDILHIPGRLNPADPESRRADYAYGKTLTDKVVLLGHREDTKTLMSAFRLRKLKISQTYNPISILMPAEESTLKSLRGLYDTDGLLEGRLPTALSFREGTWWWKDKVYVPLSMRDMILKQIHKTPSAGHWGEMKTLDLLTRTFDWPNSRLDVLKFCSLCTSCQSIKVDRRPRQGIMMPLPISD